MGHNTFDELLQDFLMYSKCLLLVNGDLGAVKNTLSVLTNDFLNGVKINYKEVRNSIDELLDSNREGKKMNMKDLDIYSVSGKAKSVNTHRKIDTTDFHDVGRILYVYGIIAAMHSFVKDTANAERVYARYCNIVEKIFGIQSVEAGNCYYYVGAFYYETAQYDKALLCMKKALYNREHQLGESNPACADCHFNIGMIYKKRGKAAKARKELKRALGIRREKIGRQSLECSKVLEELGKLELEESNYQQALADLQECYEIRKKVIRSDKHPDVLRISLLLSFLNKKLGRGVGERSETAKDCSQITKFSFSKGEYNTCLLYTSDAADE
eukprot:TRINITY_DN15320_c0_g3_i1.p1 TRINITY_DN15320_c0_g3~~TRINITY_DN15320_c0_g3_i1.p1  ORF type:complete len:327 (+),score=87.17 TRINITY_DN15320_c0_g3_i1:99-1079(+)